MPSPPAGRLAIDVALPRTGGTTTPHSAARGIAGNTLGRRITTAAVPGMDATTVPHPTSGPGGTDHRLAATGTMDHALLHPPPDAGATAGNPWTRAAPPGIAVPGTDVRTATRHKVGVCCPSREHSQTGRSRDGWDHTSPWARGAPLPLPPPLFPFPVLGNILPPKIFCPPEQNILTPGTEYSIPPGNIMSPLSKKVITK